MPGLSEWLDNKEPLKIAILDYKEPDLDVVHCSYEYYKAHQEVFRREKEKDVSKREFEERLYEYLWTPKVSELMVILYLEERAPTIYEANRLLKRTPRQYSATFKAVKKLEELDIVKLEAGEGSSRQEKRVRLATETVTLYGDDEFRAMMLAEWETEAKRYTERKLAWLREEKEKVREHLKKIKKGKRDGKHGW